jgi:hypothetical protein
MIFWDYGNLFTPIHYQIVNGATQFNKSANFGLNSDRFSDYFGGDRLNFNLQKNRIEREIGQT